MHEQRLDGLHDLTLAIVAAHPPSVVALAEGVAASDGVPLAEAQAKIRLVLTKWLVVSPAGTPRGDALWEALQVLSRRMQEGA